MTHTALQNSGVALPRGHELLWYEIDSVLGHGGFGITYLAHDKNLGRDVALKEYLPRSWADRQTNFDVTPVDEENEEMYERGLTRFMAEARTLAKFKHPNIVQVLAVFEQHQTAYMAMEYEQGGSLSDLLRSRRFKVTQESLLRILLPISDGLQNVHDMGFLHRDIKPANIYLREDGSPVLIDFGSSRETGVLNTSDVTVLITAGYAPPEQYSKGFGEQGPWTDIYSLAASIYHSICGEVVADALQRSAAVQSGTADPIKPLSAMPLKGFSDEFKYAIDTALAVKPADRPQSLGEWRQLLEAGSDAYDVTQLRPQATQANIERSSNTTAAPNRSREGYNTPGDAVTSFGNEDTATQIAPGGRSNSNASTRDEYDRSDNPKPIDTKPDGKGRSGIAFAAIGAVAIAAVGLGAYYFLNKGVPANAPDNVTTTQDSNNVVAQLPETNTATKSPVEASPVKSSEPNSDTQSTPIERTPANSTAADTNPTQNIESTNTKNTESDTTTDNDASAPVATNSQTEAINENPTITDGLPIPAFAINLTSPLDTISTEIQALSAELEMRKKELESSGKSPNIQNAIDVIGAKFTALASSSIVKANSDFSEAVAEGLVQSVGVTAQNQGLLAELVRSTSAVNGEYLRGLLNASSLTADERETLVFGIASSSEAIQTSLKSESNYLELIILFKQSIVATIKAGKFSQAAQMTSVALLLQPNDEELQLLSSHLSQER